MPGSGSEPSRSPLADRELLTRTGLREEIPERADAFARLEAAVEPSLAGDRDTGVLVYGDPGTGKTELCVRLANRFERSGGTAVRLDCRPSHTAFGLCRRLANGLGADLPPTGLALETARDRARRRVRDAPVPTCLVLDDLDALRTDVRRAFLLDVVDAFDGAVATVATGEGVGFRNELDRAELEVFADGEFPLAAYDAEALRTIFEDRAARAFCEDAVAPELLSATVAATLERGGDAGYGLELLAAAGEVAADAGDSTVSAEHVRLARERVAVEALAERLAGLSEHQRLALRGLCSLAAAGRTPVRIGRAFEAYVDACGEDGVEPNTERSLQNYLRRVVETGLVESEEVRTDTGGKFNRYRLARSLDLLRAALELAADAESA